MQASIESTGNLERRLSFSLPEDRLQSHINGRLGEIARTTRIKGFRPGKVPAKVIEQRFGAQVRGEALDGLLRETFDAAVREHDLRIVGSPRIDKGDEGEFSFVATVEVVPDFGDIDVSKLTVVRHTAEISDADIDQMIENLQNQRRTWAPVSRGAQEGDLVALETFSQAGDERLPAEGTEKGTIVIGQNMMFETIEKGLVGLAYYELGFRQISNGKRPINKVDDLAGLKLRVIPNPINVDWVKALGANPTPLPFPEVYGALEQGAIDAQENPISVINANKFYEVQKNVVLSNHQYNPQSVIISKKFWDGLDAGQKKIISEAAVEAAKYQRAQARGLVASALDNMKKNGMQVTQLPPAEVTKLRDMMRPVTAKYAVNVGQETVKELQTELAKVRK